MGDWVQDHESGPLKLLWQEMVVDFGSEGKGEREGWIWEELGENKEMIGCGTWFWGGRWMTVPILGKRKSVTWQQKGDDKFSWGPADLNL